MNNEGSFRFNGIEIQVTEDSIVIHMPDRRWKAVTSSTEKTRGLDDEFKDFLQQIGCPTGRKFILLAAYFFSEKKALNSFNVLDVEHFYDVAEYLSCPRYLHTYISRLMKDGFVERSSDRNNSNPAIKQYSVTEQGTNFAKSIAIAANRRSL